MKSEIKFSDGIPEESRRRLIYPEELLDKKCGGCVRFTANGSKLFWKLPEEESNGHHCSMRGRDTEIFTEDKACVHYWDKAEEDARQRAHDEAVEKRREELWAIYAPKDPIKLPIVNDGYGVIPMCPVCGEMPYSTEQCHWCGQRFVQDEEVEKYTTPDTVQMNCPQCGAPGKANASKYNGHKHFHCDVCGCRFME